jgi:hypothetical protein
MFEFDFKTWAWIAGLIVLTIFMFYLGAGVVHV